jgi:hypothetical protein
MVRTSLAFLVIAVVTSSTTAARADAGDQWCRQGFDFTSLTAIPVYIHPDVAEELLDESDTAWTDTELQWEVQFAIERMMDEAPSGMPPMYFAGFEPAGTPWDSNPGQGKIALRPNHDDFLNQCTPHESGTFSTGTLIFLSNSTWSTCSVRYQHWHDTPSNNTYKPLLGVFTHELMHALGFAHADTCQVNTPPCTDNPGEDQYCGWMSPGAGADLELTDAEFADWDALRTVYGPWENDGQFRVQSTDGSTWTTLSGGISSGPNAAAGVGAGASTAIPILVTEANQAPHFWLWNSSGGAFTDWGQQQNSNNFGQTAISVGSGYYYAFFLSDVNENTSAKQPRYSYLNTAGSPTVVSTSQYASRQGVAGVWDPKSAKLVQAWRDKDDKIVMAITTPTGSIGTGAVPTALTGAANRAFTTPSIACGPASLTYNCVMVWATAAAQQVDNAHVLRWVHFYVSGTTLNFDSTIYSTGNVMFGPPQVTYRGPTTSSSAFVVAYKNPGRCFYTLVKGTATTSTFGSEASHCAPTGAHVSPPLMGSTSGGTAESWAEYNLED